MSSDDVKMIGDIKKMAILSIIEITAGPKAYYQFGSDVVSWSSYLSHLSEMILWCEQKQDETI